jgi:hypothetical protein
MRQHILRGVFIATLIFGGSGIVAAGPLQDSDDAVDRGDYAVLPGCQVPGCYC